jgi:hypothetical protein
MAYLLIVKQSLCLMSLLTSRHSSPFEHLPHEQIHSIVRNAKRLIHKQCCDTHRPVAYDLKYMSNTRTVPVSTLIAKDAVIWLGCEGWHLFDI